MRGVVIMVGVVIMERGLHRKWEGSTWDGVEVGITKWEGHHGIIMGAVIIEVPMLDMAQVSRVWL